MAWEQRLVCGQDWSGAVAFQLVFWNWPLNFVAFSVCKVLALGGVHFKMGPFELIVLFGKDDGASESGLFFKILFVNGSFGKIRLDVVKLAQMPTTTAFRTEAALSTMIHKIGVGEFRHGLIEGRMNSIIGFGDHLMASAGVKLLSGFVHLFIEFNTLIEVFLDFRQSSNAGTEFLLEGWLGAGVRTGCLGSWTDETGLHWM